MPPETAGLAAEAFLGLSVRRETAREYPEISQKMPQALRTVPQALELRETLPR